MLRIEDTLATLPRITPQWLAGFFDGEGTVLSEVVLGKYGNTGISITQKDIKVLTLIEMKYGVGAISCDKNNVHKFRIRGHASLPFLKDIEPFCVVKRTQVEKAIELLSLVGDGWNGRTFTETELAVRIQLCEDIKQLRR